MDNQDQGHEGHACSKCGRKKRCAHKNICGTVEGYKLLVSERQTHSDASDEDPHSQGPNSLDTGNNEKAGEILTTSGDEEFLDATANFSDGSPSPGSKEPSATDVEIGNIKYQEFSGSSDFNDVNQLIVKSTDDGQMQERVKEGNMLELQGQLSSSHVDPPSSSSITDLRTFEHNEDFIDLSSDSNPSKAEATPDMLLENKIHAGENVRPCSLASVAKETNLKENEEIKSDSDMFDIAVFSDNTVSDTREGMLRIAVSDVVNSDSQVASGAFNLEEKNNAESLSLMPQEELSLDGRVLDSSMKEQESWEILAEEMHAEESIGDSSVKFITESDEIGASMNCMKFEMDENYMNHFSEKPSSGVYKSDDVVEMDKFEEPGRNDSSPYSLDVEPSAQFVSVVGETQGEHGREVSGITVVPVQDQSGNNNNNAQLPSSAIHTSIDYGIQCDSLDGNRGSVSEIIAEITNNRTSKPHTPLQSPLSEAAHSSKPESPKLEENGESAAAKAVKGEGEKGSNSSADIKRQNKKVKCKLYWILLMCCSSEDSPRR